MREFGWRKLSVVTQDESLFRAVKSRFTFIINIIVQVADNLNDIFNNEEWVLDRYDVITGQSPLSFFGRFSPFRYCFIK